MSDIQANQAHVREGHGDNDGVSCDPVTVGISAVAIDKMRFELGKLFDQYDAIARELHRMHIPLQTTWATIRELASARLQKMVEFHDRAHAQQLSLELGENKLSAAQILRLHTEVVSLAELLSSGMETLRTSIEEMRSMQSTAASDLGTAVPVRASAESAPDSAAISAAPAAPLDPQTEVTERPARRRRISRRSRATEVKDNEKIRTRMHEWIQSNPAAPGHSADDCTATTADCSDWRITDRLIAELFPIIEHLQAKNVDFVEWSIRHMAAKGKREPMINGTRSCGGYSKEELIESY